MMRRRYLAMRVTGSSSALPLDIEWDLSLHPQTLLALSRYFAGSNLLNTKSGQAVVVNTVEGYARTRWLDVHCESFGSNKGKATMTSLSELKHKDRYKGVRPITMGAYDGQRLVIGTAVADLLSVVVGERINQEDDLENWCVDRIGIVYQLRQLKTKFQEPSTYLFSRASEPLTNMHPCMPYTTYTVFVRIEVE
ncbi:hypothetical protein KI688_003460 [Linnemannia hyalina]|uniref:Uncharacterized protein n=1 Tax=Linnemannia hyalina TaxID=64524 RepID=A0A9P8BST9_9FUNG|nr:hypothetical protein KI688_003460 [Linnemannia hyalina]